MTVAAVIEARADEAKAELRALAEYYRRSLGQRARWHLNQWRKKR